MSCRLLGGRNTPKYSPLYNRFCTVSTPVCGLAVTTAPTRVSLWDVYVRSWYPSFCNITVSVAVGASACRPHASGPCTPEMREPHSEPRPSRRDHFPGSHGAPTDSQPRPASAATVQHPRKVPINAERCRAKLDQLFGGHPPAQDYLRAVEKASALTAPRSVSLLRPATSHAYREGNEQFLALHRGMGLKKPELHASREYSPEALFDQKEHLKRVTHSFLGSACYHIAGIE